MNVPVLTMDADQALGKMEEYRDALRANPDSETADADRALYRGFKALAKGMRLVDIHEVFRNCPLDDKGRPKLAICRADAEWCMFQKSTWHWRRGYRPAFTVGRTNKSPTIPNTVYLLGDILNGDSVTRDRIEAMLPSIPPALRPKDSLENYHILWEAEWQNVPPRDPFLLKHLEGSLYIVVAEWDLTALEMSVLAQVRKVN